MRAPISRILSSLALLAGSAAGGFNFLKTTAKIVKMLEDMSTHLEAERENDDAVHKKYQCWCDKETEEKNLIMKKQGAEMKKQDAAVKSAFSESEMHALEELNNKCMTDQGEFSKKDQELEKSIMTAKGAIAEFKKHNFLQGGGKSIAQQLTNTEIRSAFQTVVDRQMLSFASNSNSFVALERFLSTTEQEKTVSGGGESESFLQQSPGFGSYANQSGQIFGILNQMLKELERDLSEAVTAKKQRIKSCDGGVKALNKEVDLLQKTLATLDARLGELAQQQANAKEDYLSAKESYGNVIEFIGKVSLTPSAGRTRLTTSPGPTPMKRSLSLSRRPSTFWITTSPLRHWETHSVELQHPLSELPLLLPPSFYSSLPPLARQAPPRRRSLQSTATM